MSRANGRTHWRRKHDPSPIAAVSRVIRVLVLAVLGLMVLLGISEFQFVADWLGGAKPSSPLVGLVAGHWQNDSGAVCPDGLQEMEVNLAIARRVADVLRRQGYRVEVLPEFSPRLNGFGGAALLAIHNDSCVAGLSGFKVARMTHSSVPEVEDALVDSLYRSYAEATGLKPHPNTITDDMRQYHALRQLAPGTPGAIIECGFLGGDRYLLTQEQERVAVGISNGLLAFLKQRTVQPTPTMAQRR